MNWFKSLFDFIINTFKGDSTQFLPPEGAKPELPKRVNAAAEVPGFGHDAKPDKPKKPVQTIIPIINAGHGAINPHTNEYTTAPAKMYKWPDFTFYEGVFNRSVAGFLLEMLAAKGYAYHTVYHPYKDTPLKERTDNANNFAKQAEKHCVYFSIHGNAFGKESANGVEHIVYTKPSKYSLDIAELLRVNTVRTLPELRMRGTKRMNLHEVRETKIPAVLSEFGFFTNRHDVELMMQPEFQRRCAKVIFDTFETLNIK